ncbi:major facilitator superfamily domain-containing protein [Hygrophoropsis aurantiaca]|uniref:Major facilitator superfamily domain-containing protein n=1 Tax=Hygrophoropsis aurantiaca TaxID=72124 RepID=A0ACB8AMC5_9AGAM|nr:major facilitator superfamily domain-containing protein [Hygrophoropsis aurantiaca]
MSAHSANEKCENPSAAESSSLETYERPKGLRGVYYHPVTQVIMLGFTCFLCPGIYNALTGLGGGGQVDATISANSLSALYAALAFFAFFAGTVNNIIGPRRTLLIGTTGYALYIGSYLAINIHPNAGDFVVASGAFLGVTAAFLWTAQGSLLLSYATEAQKGTFICIFWAIFSMGAVVGSAVSFGQNFHLTDNSVGNGTYIGFLILALIGIVIPLLMADVEKMTRTDGSKIVIARHPTWKTEFYGLWVSLTTDPSVLLLFPMFFASNYFYTWQFNDYNSALFNIRARSLNNFVYWVAQIMGSAAIGVTLDTHRFRRRTRAFVGWFVLLAGAFLVHIWAYFYQRTYTRQSIPPNARKMDIYDSAFPSHVWLMIFNGLLDAMWQTMTMWIIGAMSNDTNKLAVFSGFYHSMQAAGAAGVWRLDAVGTPYMSIFLSTWCLVAAALILALPMIYYRIKDHTTIEDEIL